MGEALQCWCGNADFQAFSPDYRKCTECGTLVGIHFPGPEIATVLNDETDFYGQEYWQNYLVEQHNYPDISTRARFDLSERAIFWLKAVLRYCLPPSNSLELGCGHGGFVALMQQAGFEAAGLELSHWLINYAQENFSVPMYLGPIEKQNIPPESLDLILLMDVFEHFPDPVRTIEVCSQLLKPDGKIFIQTPKYDHQMSFAELEQNQDPFLKQIKPIEHVYLFSRQAIQKFFSQSSVEFVEFIPPCFDYDMFFIASRSPINSYSDDEITNSLQATPTGRLTQALLDLEFQKNQLDTALTEANSDRAARLANIHELENLLSIAEADRAARLENIHQLEALLSAARQQQKSNQETIAKHTNTIQVLKTKKAEFKQDLDNLELQLAIAETKQEEIQSEIIILSDKLQNAEEDRATAKNISRKLAEQISKQAKYQDQIETELRQTKNELKEQQTLTTSQLELIQQQSFNLAGLENELERIPLRFLRTWSSHISAGISKFRSNIIPRPGYKQKTLKRIVIDLTPIVPGGGNGGAKLLATTLVREFSRNIAPECDFVLLTSDDSHDELAWLDAENVRRICVNQRIDSPPQAQVDSPPVNHNTGSILQDLLRRGIHAIGQFLESILPPRVYRRFYRFYRGEWKTPRSKNIVAAIKGDILFCPFTAPYYHSSGVPTIVVVHDLQFLEYPQFFTGAEFSNADYDFRNSCLKAEKLICVSEHTRQRVLAESEINPASVKTIHTSLYNPLPPVSHQTETIILADFQIKKGRFLLYPANYWPHKNHEILLIAVRMFYEKFPHSDLKLVFTGAPSEREVFLSQSCQILGLEDKVVFAGFVEQKVLATFYQNCLALVFPSLYEGFGVPVLEAMNYGVPVLCSNLTSIPEVGQQAVHYFDSRQPDEIVTALEKVAEDGDYRQTLISKGQKRAQEFMTPTTWAQTYFDIFQETFQADRVFSNAVSGVYADHWVGSGFEVSVSPGDEKRFLEIGFEIPAWLPSEKISVRLKANGQATRRFQLPRGSCHQITMPVITAGNRVEITISPTVSPAQIGIGDDVRALSCRVSNIKILSQKSQIPVYSADF